MQRRCDEARRRVAVHAVLWRAAQGRTASEIHLIYDGGGPMFSNNIEGGCGHDTVGLKHITHHTIKTAAAFDRKQNENMVQMLHWKCPISPALVNNCSQNRIDFCLYFLLLLLLISKIKETTQNSKLANFTETGNRFQA